MRCGDSEGAATLVRNKRGGGNRERRDGGDRQNMHKGERQIGAEEVPATQRAGSGWVRRLPYSERPATSAKHLSCSNKRHTNTGRLPARMERMDSGTYDVTWGGPV
eukprot:2260691-Pleurochrysis_carterae.AAC.1